MPRESRRETVAVTGAAGGVGRATARAFGRRVAHVGLLARGVEALEAAAQEVRHTGGAAFVLPTDVADADAVERAAANKAGIIRTAALLHGQEEDVFGDAAQPCRSTHKPVRLSTNSF